MTTLISFTIAILAWVSYEVSATETSCSLGSHDNIVVPYQHQALNQSRSVRIKCMILCPRHTQRWYNDSSNVDFGDKQDDGFTKAKPLSEKTTMATKTEQGKPRSKTTTTQQDTTVLTEMTSQTPQITPAKTVGTAGPNLTCPQDVFGFTDGSNARTSAEWKNVYTLERTTLGFTPIYTITCRDDEGRTVVSGDFFKVGTTTVTCTTSDAAGNPGQCTFVVTIKVDTEGPTVECPQGVFGLTHDSNARTSVQWGTLIARDEVDGRISSSHITCRDDDEGRTVVSGDFFKVGTTTVTCTTSDAAGNTGQCTFVVTITVCNITPLGMESGAIADQQITASEVLNNDDANYGPAQARLNSHGSWCGVSFGSWIQVDLNLIQDIHGLIVQGRYQSTDRAQTFRLRYSGNGLNWTYMSDLDGNIKIYRSYVISDRHDVLVSVQSTTQAMIRSRFIRIIPLSSDGKRCMRFELITCN